MNKIGSYTIIVTGISAMIIAMTTPAKAVSLFNAPITEHKFGRSDRHLSANDTSNLLRSDALLQSAENTIVALEKNSEVTQVKIDNGTIMYQKAQKGSNTGIYSYISIQTAPHPQRKVPESSTLFGLIATFCFLTIQSQLRNGVSK